MFDQVKYAVAMRELPWIKIGQLKRKERRGPDELSRKLVEALEKHPWIQQHRRSSIHK